MLFKDQKFSPIELAHYMFNNFPDSFSIEIYKDPNNGSLEFDPDSLVYSARKPNRWPKDMQLQLYDRAIFRVHSGEENTYYRFVFEDQNSNYFIVTWGYKRCDIEQDYLLKVINLFYSGFKG